MNRYVIGVDFGTDSCRVLIVNALTGEEVVSSVKSYRRWSEGLYCNRLQNQYRQHPLDYIEAMEGAIREAISESTSGIVDKIEGIGIDTTGSTPVLTNIDGTPLALLDQFCDNPNAMFVLWKDHTSVEEATEINRLAKKWHTDYTAYEGGIYSSEWVWAKVLHLLREDEAVREAAYSWVEHCDWVTGILTGKTKPETMLRSRCAAGHKAMWHPSWGGLPSEEFLTELDPLLADFRNRLFTETRTSDTVAGYLTPEWASRLGLSSRVAVAVGAFDCHMGAVGAHITPYTLVKVIGTSTCDIMVSSYDEIGNNLIPGICGQVDGSVIPGMIGLEAGQSAYGDLFAWFSRVLKWPLKNILLKSDIVNREVITQLIEYIEDNMLSVLSKEAQKIPVSISSMVATDWLNGRRTPDADQRLKATVTGLSLGSTAPMIFRALAEAAAFGSKAIADRFLENGVAIREVIAAGGISHKSPFVMQTLADVIDMPVKVAKSTQTCALGAAMFAAVAADVYPDVERAQWAMNSGYNAIYHPNEKNREVYRDLYLKYHELGIISENF
ncbi:MAG: ribulokinase [Proteiniphilum sp.]